jgi:hypothetical protein
VSSAQGEGNNRDSETRESKRKKERERERANTFASCKQGLALADTAENKYMLYFYPLSDILYISSFLRKYILFSRKSIIFPVFFNFHFNKQQSAVFSHYDNLVPRPPADATNDV